MKTYHVGRTAALAVENLTLNFWAASTALNPELAFTIVGPIDCVTLSCVDSCRLRCQWFIRSRPMTIRVETDPSPAGPSGHGQHVDQLGLPRKPGQLASACATVRHVTWLEPLDGSPKTSLSLAHPKSSPVISMTLDQNQISEMGS